MFTPLSKKPKTLKHYSKEPRTFTQQSDRFGLTQPSRILLCSPSGSGKTNLLLNLIYDSLKWTRLYVNAKDLTEPAYEQLKDACEMAQSKNKKNQLETFYDFNNMPENIVTVDQLSKNETNLIVFDDFITDKASEPKISELFIRSRKKNATIIYIGQSYFNIPRIIRLQCSYLIFFKSHDNREVANIHQNHNLGLDKATFTKVFYEATKEPFSFLLIDNVTSDERLKIRKNFNFGLDIK